MDIAVFILVFGTAHTGQTRPDTTGHAFLHGDITFHSLLGSIFLQRPKHRHWSARVDYVCFQNIFPDGIHHISLCTYTAILRCDKAFSLFFKLIQKECRSIPVSHHNLNRRNLSRLLSIVIHKSLCHAGLDILCQLQHRWHSDTTADQKSLLSRQYGKSIAKRSHDSDLVTVCQLRKFLCSGILTRHTVYQSDGPGLTVNTAQADRPRKQL